MLRRLTISLAAATVGLSLFACGGIWDQAMSEAAVEGLGEARVVAEGCTGDGRDTVLASLDGAVIMAESGQVGIIELATLQVSIDDAASDGDISIAEATAIAQEVAAMAGN